MAFDCGRFSLEVILSQLPLKSELNNFESLLRQSVIVMTLKLVANVSSLDRCNFYNDNKNCLFIQQNIVLLRTSMFCSLIITVKFLIPSTAGGLHNPHLFHDDGGWLICF